MQYQSSLTLIQHQANGSIIDQRATDGYVNATALCKAAGKQFNDYTRLDSTKSFLTALSAKTGIPVVKNNQALIESRPGSPATGGGSWVHPQVAINLGQWLSADFAVQVSEWIVDWMSGNGSPAIRPRLPYHIRRHMMNLNEVPSGHFSVLQEMTFILIGPLDQHGYELPEKLVPDISMGRFLCKHLRDKLGIDTDNLPVYPHRYPDGRVVVAKLYPDHLLAEFRRIIREEWLPAKAMAYFKDRDPAALPYLDKVVLALPRQPKAANSPVFERNRKRLLVKKDK
jgi:hypothetical protein